MRWDEDTHGREYDLGRIMIYCADDFNLGAMENKGLNIFNARAVLAAPDRSTDDEHARVKVIRMLHRLIGPEAYRPRQRPPFRALEADARGDQQLARTPACGGCAMGRPRVRSPQSESGARVAACVRAAELAALPRT